MNRLPGTRLAASEEEWRLLDLAPAINQVRGEVAYEIYRYEIYRSDLRDFHAYRSELLNR